jgi:ferritin-like metal-binding protein YciE
MAKKASSRKLQQAFTKHEKETERQVKRLEQVFQILGKRAIGKKCAAIDGNIEEGEEVMKEAKDHTIRDAAMLAAAQSVEHYEISRYGTLVAAGRSEADASELAELCSGHSLRAGYCTASAIAGVPEWKARRRPLRRDLRRLCAGGRGVDGQRA